MLSWLTNTVWPLKCTVGKSCLIVPQWWQCVPTGTKQVTCVHFPLRKWWQSLSFWSFVKLSGMARILHTCCLGSHVLRWTTSPCPCVTQRSLISRVSWGFLNNISKRLDAVGVKEYIHGRRSWMGWHLGQGCHELKTWLEDCKVQST